ncbi:MAG: hypothetical protein NC320_11265 [Clostridium sp.]|nr:hypothetical protein [Clostridium sp.]
MAFQIFDDYFYDDCIHAESNTKLDVRSQIEILIREIAEIHYSIDEIMKQEINVNIGVDTGDSGWDYTANNVPPGYGADHYLSESDCASIIWLTKQQGQKNLNFILLLII